jgi:ABC-2 type transport system ATP-binding protein
LGTAKAIYAQIVDNASGQVLGNTNTPIPVTLDGKEHTIENFEIANIAYTAPSTPGAALTLQFVANSSLFQNTAVIWNVNISDISVSLPTTGTAIPNPVPGLLPA